MGLGQYECSHTAANESKAYRSNFRLFSLGIVPYSTVIFHMIQSTPFFSSFINCFREQKQGQSEYMSWLKANQRSLSKAEVSNGCMPALYSEDNSSRKTRI